MMLFASLLVEPQPIRPIIPTILERMKCSDKPLKYANWIAVNAPAHINEAADIMMEQAQQHLNRSSDEDLLYALHEWLVAHGTQTHREALAQMLLTTLLQSQDVKRSYCYGSWIMQIAPANRELLNEYFSAHIDATIHENNLWTAGRWLKQHAPDRHPALVSRLWLLLQGSVPSRKAIVLADILVSLQPKACQHVAELWLQKMLRLPLIGTSHLVYADWIWKCAPVYRNLLRKQMLDHIRALCHHQQYDAPLNLADWLLQRKPPHTGELMEAILSYPNFDSLAYLRLIQKTWYQSYEEQQYRFFLYFSEQQRRSLVVVLGRELQEQQHEQERRRSILILVEFCLGIEMISSHSTVRQLPFEVADHIADYLTLHSETTEKDVERCLLGRLACRGRGVSV